MTFEEILDHAVAMLQRRGRVTYRTLQRQFQLDEDALNDPQGRAALRPPEDHDDAGRGLVWTPAAPVVAAEAGGRFDAVLAAVTALRCEGRITYRRLTLACGLDAALLAAVCRELTFHRWRTMPTARASCEPRGPLRRTAPRLIIRPAAGALRRCRTPGRRVARLVDTSPCARGGIRPPKRRPSLGACSTSS